MSRNGLQLPLDVKSNHDVSFLGFAAGELLQAHRYRARAGRAAKGQPAHRGLALLAAAQITLYQRYIWEDYSLGELADDVRHMIIAHKEHRYRMQ
jgi:hypothetical protein